MAEHVEIIDSADVLRRACLAGDDAAVRAGAAALAGLLTPHATAEEAGIFAVLAEDPEFTEHVHGLCAEHRDLDAALGRIAAGDHAAFPRFEHALRRHVDKEENGLFPAAAIAFAGPEWERVDSLTPPAPA